MHTASRHFPSIRGIQRGCDSTPELGWYTGGEYFQSHRPHQPEITQPMHADHETPRDHDLPAGTAPAAHDQQAGTAQTAPAAHGNGHDKHAGHSVAMFRDKFWLSLLLTIPVLIWSRDPQAWLRYMAPELPGSGWIPAILGSAVFLYGGLVFVRGAVGELRVRQPGMMTLISLAIVVAFATSWSGTLGLFEVEIWWELASLITIMLLGHWLEMR